MAPNRKRNNKGRFIPQQSDVVSADIRIPNHSGDHDAGRILETPTVDTNIVNKKYVDDQFPVTHASTTGKTAEDHQALVTVVDGTTIDLTIAGQEITAETIDAAIDHNALLNYLANEHVINGDIVSTQPIDFKASNDNDDYFRMTTTSNIPRLGLVGGDKARIVVNKLDLGMGDGTYDYVGGPVIPGEYVNFSTDGVSRLIVQGIIPTLQLVDTNGPTDEKQLLWLVNSGLSSLTTRSDAAVATINTVWTIDMSNGNIRFPNKVDVEDDLTLPKTSGKGIKVDNTTPTFGFRDILGDQFTKNIGATKPTLTTYNGAVQAFQFGVGDEAFMTFHIPHDYVAGTPIFLHIHWSHIGTLVTGGTVTFKATSILAKGHNQQAFQSTPSVGTFNGTASTTQYQHILSEVLFSDGTPTGIEVDTDNLEPDSVIEMTFEVDANDITVSSGGVPDIFVHFVDIHYQSTNIATKDKAPDFYA